MATSGSGAGDFESLARQYWQAWGDAMRQGGMSAPGMSAQGMGAAGMPGAGMPGAGISGTGMPGWQDAVDWWSRLAQGGNPQTDDVVQRFNAQARDWYGAMQQLAARFSAQDAGAADIASEWKRALGAIGDNPFPEMFKAMRGQGAQGMEQWTEAAAPWLDAMRRERSSWLGMPAFGQGREHQERLQALAQAQLDVQQSEAAYNALMLKALQRAHDLFSDKLIAHEEPGRQLSSARALFDLWIDAAEEAYAEVALSAEFRKAYGAMVNAQMRLRQGVQREVEQSCAMLGMPTRTELDGAHRKLAELERVVRRLRDAVGKAGPDGPARSAKPAGKKPAAKNESAKKAAVRKSSPKRAPSKPAAKKTVKKAAKKGSR